MIFDLVRDFADVLAATPEGHPRRRVLKLLDEAVRRDVHFIDRHPTTLFQCLWNSCWWYDAPQAAGHYEEPEDGWPGAGPPWDRPGPKLYTALETWRRRKEGHHPGVVWVRSLRPPPSALGSAQRLVLRGHAGWARCSAFSGDGRTLLSGDDEGLLIAWDADDGRELARLRGHTGAVTALVSLRDHRRFLSASDDGTLRLWDVSQGVELACLPGPTAGPTCLALSPDGRTLVSGHDREEAALLIWDLDAARLRASCRWRSVTDVAWCPDGSGFVSAWGDREVGIWDGVGGKLLGEMTFQLPVTRVACSPDTRCVAAGMLGFLGVWDPDRNVVRMYRCHWARTVGLAYSSAGMLATVVEAPTNTIGIWDPATGEELAYFALDDVPTHLAWSPDGTRVSATCRDGSVRVFDPKGESPRWLPDRADGRVMALAFSPDGRKVATGSECWRARVWDAASGECLAVLRGHEGVIWSVSFSADGTKLLSRSFDRTSRVWDLRTNECIEVTGEDSPSPFPAGPPGPTDGGPVFLHLGYPDTAIRSTASDADLAWFPVALAGGLDGAGLPRHPTGPAWAGRSGTHLYLFTLEGDVGTNGPAP